MYVSLLFLASFIHYITVIMLVRLIQDDACSDCLFSLLYSIEFYVYITSYLFILPVNEHLASFQVLTTANSAAINILFSVS